MPLTLFGSMDSGSAAIEMALRAAAVSYRLVTASSWEPASARAELLALNPLGQIPTLQLADGSVLTESAAILIHLGLAYPQAGLLPTLPIERAMDIRGLVYIAANCYAAVSVSDYPEQWTTASTRPAHDRVRAAARAQLHRRWDIFADTCGGLLERAEPGALAFLGVVVSQWSGARQHLQVARPAFHDLLLRLESHPRLAPTLLEHRAGGSAE